MRSVSLPRMRIDNASLVRKRHVRYTARASPRVSNPGPRLALEAGTLTVNHDIDCDYNVHADLNPLFGTAEDIGDANSLGRIFPVQRSALGATCFRCLRADISCGGRVAGHIRRLAASGRRRLGSVPERG